MKYSLTFAIIKFILSIICAINIVYEIYVKHNDSWLNYTYLGFFIIAIIFWFDDIKKS